MRTSGVICECNPLHAGHKYLFAQARRFGADAVIAVMSGCFTQRGEAAVLSPRVRAQMLLAGGADAVFDLPFPYCCAPGEQFGAAGVSLLSRLDVDELWFGSECGDLARLRAVEEATGTPEFLAAYRSATRSGRGTAASYADCLRELLGTDAPTAPNDLLAVSYLRALRKTGSRMIPRTVRRTGAGYHDGQLPVLEGFPSATALRKRLMQAGTDALKDYMTPLEIDLVRCETAAGRAPADLSRLSSVFLACLRMTPPEKLARVATLGGGLGQRLAELARTGTDLESLLRNAGVNCPTSRLRRGLLYALTDTTEDDLRTEPACAVLLAANRTGCRFLSERRQSRTIPVVTKRADLPDTAEAKTQAAFAEKAFGLWSLCLPEPIAPAVFLRNPAYIEV